MYSSCIFCSHDLGRNEALETFPVGSTIAFDAWKGRLWAVCPGCGRWNLAPIEERWEAVERAEKRFRDTRLRIQSENVGVAQLPEGMRLVRVGDALPGELAAWRYGIHLRRRRRSYQVNQAIAVAASLLMPEVLSLRVLARQNAIIYRLPDRSSPTGEEVRIREKHLRGARIELHDGEGLRVFLPGALSAGMPSPGWLRRVARRRGVEISGRPAQDLLARGMVRINSPGASERDLREALARIELSGSLERILYDVAGGTMILAERRWTLMKSIRGRAAAGYLPTSSMLAFEMALHEAAERRALEGELQELKERWREAEEIASIADSLPDGLPRA